MNRPVRRNAAWLIHGLRRTFHQPGDVVLCARIGRFMTRAASELESVSLPEFLGALEHRGELVSSDVLHSRARIARLRQAWLNLDRFAELNTCYIRALTLYRFLNPPGGLLRIHFGVNPGEDPQDRIHGHAWVTWNGDMLEAPDAVLSGAVSELYVYPEAAPGSQGGRRPVGS